jgi:hypothetical protein
MNKRGIRDVHSAREGEVTGRCEDDARDVHCRLGGRVKR